MVRRPAQSTRELNRAASCCRISIDATTLRSGRTRIIRFCWSGRDATTEASGPGSCALLADAAGESLFLWGGAIFACRQCHNLAYESQNETSRSRALTKVQAIRLKLGGEPAGDFPPKPKGIHWRTYYLLKALADEAESRSWPPWLYKMMARASQRNKS